MLCNLKQLIPNAVQHQVPQQCQNALHLETPHQLESQQVSRDYLTKAATGQKQTQELLSLSIERTIYNRTVLRRTY